MVVLADKLDQEDLSVAPSVAHLLVKVAPTLELELRQVMVARVASVAPSKLALKADLMVVLKSDLMVE